MSLDALAPDQRAVVQLVLQQDRSYDDLAGLLGITPAAVRERAHRGLERLAPGEALATSERETIGDYLLGLGTTLRILSPDRVREALLRRARNLLEDNQGDQPR